MLDNRMFGAVAVEEVVQSGVADRCVASVEACRVVVVSEADWAKQPATLARSVLPVVA
jgi:hypothetical protein